VLQVSLKGYFLSFTTDIWTEGGSSYIALTGHLLTDAFVKINLCLECSSFAGSHTGESIANAIEDILKSYKLKPSECITITTDNGANVVKGCRVLSEQLGWHLARVPCTAHSLERTAIQHTSSPAVKETLTKLRTVRL
jgi:hypothetical protein